MRDAAAELEGAGVTGPAPDFADLLLDVGDVTFRYAVDLVLAVFITLSISYLAFLFPFCGGRLIQVRHCSVFFFAISLYSLS